VSDLVLVFVSLVLVLASPVLVNITGGCTLPLQAWAGASWRPPAYSLFHILNASDSTAAPPRPRWGAHSGPP